MKKIVIIIIGLYVFSCSDNINQYAEFKDKYQFFLLLTDDSTKIAYLVKNFEPSKNNKKLDIKDYVVKNAVVRLWYGEKYVEFKENKGELKNYPLGVYYSTKIQLIVDAKYDIEVIFNDGTRILKSSTKLPEFKIKGILDEKWIEPIPYRNDPLTDKDVTRFQIVAEDNNMVVCKAYVVYQQPNDKPEEMRKERIPDYFMINENEKIPVFSKPDYFKFRYLNHKMIAETMAKVYSENKKNKFMYIELEVFCFDKYLSKYYSNVELSENETELFLDNVDYTNIIGGYGIFGCIKKDYVLFRFSTDYLDSKGYLYAF